MTNPFFIKHFDHVSVEPSSDYPGEVAVHPIWKGVDRPDVGGWIVKPAIAARLAKAVESGAAFSRVQLLTDVNGQTYINATHAVMGRRANVDLKRLGY